MFDILAWFCSSKLTIAVESPPIQNTLVNLVANLLAVMVFAGPKIPKACEDVRPVAPKEWACGKAPRYITILQARWLMMLRKTWNNWELCCGTMWR